jgi:hypothetical protein
MIVRHIAYSLLEFQEYYACFLILFGVSDETRTKVYYVLLDLFQHIRIAGS